MLILVMKYSIENTTEKDDYFIKFNNMKWQIHITSQINNH